MRSHSASSARCAPSAPGCWRWTGRSRTRSRRRSSWPSARVTPSSTRRIRTGSRDRRPRRSRSSRSSAGRPTCSSSPTAAAGTRPRMRAASTRRAEGCRGSSPSRRSSAATRSPRRSGSASPCTARPSRTRLRAPAAGSSRSERTSWRRRGARWLAKRASSASPRPRRDWPDSRTASPVSASASSASSPDTG